MLLSRSRGAGHLCGAPRGGCSGGGDVHFLISHREMTGKPSNDAASRTQKTLSERRLLNLPLAEGNAKGREHGTWRKYLTYEKRRCNYEYTRKTKIQIWEGPENPVPVPQEMELLDKETSSLPSLFSCAGV